MHRSTCLALFLLGLAVSQANPAPKVIEKKSLAENPKVEKKEDIKIDDAGEDKDRAKKSASFCVHVQPDATLTQTPCNCKNKDQQYVIQPYPSQQPQQQQQLQQLTQQQQLQQLTQQQLQQLTQQHMQHVAQQPLQQSTSAQVQPSVSAVNIVPTQGVPQTMQPLLQIVQPMPQPNVQPVSGITMVQPSMQSVLSQTSVSSEQTSRSMSGNSAAKETGREQKTMRMMQRSEVSNNADERPTAREYNDARMIITPSNQLVPTPEVKQQLVTLIEVPTISLGQQYSSINPLYLAAMPNAVANNPFQSYLPYMAFTSKTQSANTVNSENPWNAKLTSKVVNNEAIPLYNSQLDLQSGQRASASSSAYIAANPSLRSTIVKLGGASQPQLIYQSLLPPLPEFSFNISPFTKAIAEDTRPQADVTINNYPHLKGIKTYVRESSPTMVSPEHQATFKSIQSTQNERQIDSNTGMHLVHEDLIVPVNSAKVQRKVEGQVLRSGMKEDPRENKGLKHEANGNYASSN